MQRADSFPGCYVREVPGVRAPERIPRRCVLANAVSNSHRPAHNFLTGAWQDTPGRTLVCAEFLQSSLRAAWCGPRFFFHLREVVMTSKLHIKALVVAMSLAAVAAAAAAAPAAPAVARATILRHGDTAAGPLALSQPMHIVVALKLRNQAQLHSFIASLHQPNAPKPMTSEQFMQAHSPTSAQAQAVGDFMRHAGFTNVEIAPNRLLVSGDAPAASVQAAFGTKFVSVKTHDGRMAYANTQD